MDPLIVICINHNERVDAHREALERGRRGFRARIKKLTSQYHRIMRRQWDITLHTLRVLVTRPSRTRVPNKVRSSDWWDRIVQQHYTDDDWLADFRMRQKAFEILCEELKGPLTPSLESLQVPLDVRKKVAVTLYKLASCAEYRVVGNQFGIHKSTVQQTFYAVIGAMNTILVPALIIMPTDVEAEEIALQVQKNYNFPQACLSIDGSHIPVLPPKEGHCDFVNRTGWPSIVLQGLVDNRYRFRNISCVLPGSAHDARVLAESNVFKHAETVVPKSPKLIDDMEVPLMVLGDAAYPLLPWLIKGFTGHLTPEQESFNVCLDSVRISVEIAFCRLKSRWRCLLKRIDISYKFVPQVVAACCALHNFLENGEEPFDEQWLETVQEAEIMYPQPPVFRSGERDDDDMSLIRNHLCQHLAATLPLR